MSVNSIELEPVTSGQLRMLLALVRREIYGPGPRVAGINVSELQHLRDNIELMEMGVVDGVVGSVGLVR